MGRRLVCVAACAAVLLAAGCGGSKGQHADAHSRAAERPPGISRTEPADQPAAGKMTFRYEDATTPEAQQGRQLMSDAKVLENVAAHVNDTLNLPHDVGAVGKHRRIW